MNYEMYNNAYCLEIMSTYNTYNFFPEKQCAIYAERCSMFKLQGTAEVYKHQKISKKLETKLRDLLTKRSIPKLFVELRKVEYHVTLRCLPAICKRYPISNIDRY